MRFVKDFYNYPHITNSIWKITFNKDFNFFFIRWKSINGISEVHRYKIENFQNYRNVLSLLSTMIVSY